MENIINQRIKEGKVLPIPTIEDYLRIRRENRGVIGIKFILAVYKVKVIFTIPRKHKTKIFYIDKYQYCNIGIFYNCAPKLTSCVKFKSNILKLNWGLSKQIWVSTNK